MLNRKNPHWTHVLFIILTTLILNPSVQANRGWAGQKERKLRPPIKFKPPSQCELSLYSENDKWSINITHWPWWLKRELEAELHLKNISATVHNRMWAKIDVELHGPEVPFHLWTYYNAETKTIYINAFYVFNNPNNMVMLDINGQEGLRNIFKAAVLSAVETFPQAQRLAFPFDSNSEIVEKLNALPFDRETLMSDPGRIFKLLVEYEVAHQLGFTQLDAEDSEFFHVPGIINESFQINEEEFAGLLVLKRSNN